MTFYAKLRSWGLHPRDRFEDESPSGVSSVRRQRAAASFKPSDSFTKAAEPFEPPTRTSKLPSRPDD